MQHRNISRLLAGLLKRQNIYVGRHACSAQIFQAVGWITQSSNMSAGTHASGKNISGCWLIA